MKFISVTGCFIAYFFFNSTILSQNIENSPSKAVPDQYTIYLTFDDGPLDSSSAINNIILEEKVKANVFVVGSNQAKKNIKNQYDLYIKNPYIEMVNHSYSHANGHYKKFYKDSIAVLKDFLKCQEALNLPNKIARLPGRNQWRLSDTSINDIKSGSSSADLLFKEGFTVFGWDMIWYDNNPANSGQSVNKMVNKIEKLLRNGKTVRKNHLVLLLHDQFFFKKCSQCKLKQLIDSLKMKGNYTFEHLSNYPE